MSPTTKGAIVVEITTFLWILLLYVWIRRAMRDL